MSKFISVYKKFLPLIVVAMMLTVPVIVGAQLDEPTPPITGDPIELSDLESLISTIANFLIAVGVIIAVIFIIIGGIKYMAAGGDSSKAGEARSMIINGLIGAAVVLGVGVLLATAGYILEAFSQGTL